jgi:hypothetical protein
MSHPPPQGIIIRWFVMGEEKIWKIFSSPITNQRGGNVKQKG